MNNYIELITIAGITIIASVALFIINRKTQRKITQRYLSGISWLCLLRQLLTAIQQHRGFTSAYLHGDRSAQKHIEALQLKIKAQTQKVAHHDKWIENNERWQSINEHWQRLSSNYINQQASYALEQHNKLVLNILYLIEDCAEQHHLQELYLSPDHSADELWKTTLFNAEFIGQARALGTGVAAARHCSSVERIRLKYLHSRLSDYYQQTTNTQIKGKLAPLLETINNEIMVTLPSIQPMDYFAIATAPLESVIQSFDQSLEQLMSQLK